MIEKPSLPVCAFGAGAAHAAALALILPIAITLPAPKHEARGTVSIQVSLRTTAPSTPFIEAAMARATGGRPQAILEGEGDVDEGSWTVLEPEDVTGALPDMPEQAPAEPANLIEQAALPASAPDVVVPEHEMAKPTPLVEQAALPASAEDVTGSLPEVTEQAAFAEPAPPVRQAALSTSPEAVAPVEAATPVDAPQAAVPEATLLEDAPAPVIEEKVVLATVESSETTLSEQSDFMPDVVPRPLRKPAVPVVRETVEQARPAPVAAPAPRRQVTRARPQAQPQPKPFKGLFGGTRATPMKEFPFGQGR